MTSADINLKDLTYTINSVPEIPNLHYKFSIQGTQHTP